MLKGWGRLCPLMAALCQEAGRPSHGKGIKRDLAGKLGLSGRPCEIHACTKASSTWWMAKEVGGRRKGGRTEDLESGVSPAHIWPCHACHRAAPETTPLWTLFITNLSLSSLSLLK